MSAISTATAVAIGTAAGAGIGGVAQAISNHSAASMQNDYNNKALADAQAQRAWQQQQYGDYLSRLQPFNQAGQAAAGTLQSRLAQGPYRPSAANLQLPSSSVGNLAPGGSNG